jgi:hypothetical protein
MRLSSNLSMTWIGHDVSSSPEASLHRAHTDRVVFLLLGQGKQLHGLSPRANYTDRATTDCWRSDCQLLRIEGGT